MTHGDVVAPTGSASSGPFTLIGLTAAAPGQFESPAGTVALPVGAATSSTSVVVRSVVTSTQGDVGLDVEARPLGTDFTGVPTQSSGTTFATGTDVAVTVGGLLEGTSYHWRLRPASSLGGTGAWIPFGGNAETARDFSRDSSLTTIAGPLEQRDPFGADVPVGGAARAFLRLRAPALNSAGLDVLLEIEVAASGAPFTGQAPVSSALVPSGAVAEAVFRSPTAGDFRWQARAVSAAGSASAWSDFGANAAGTDFHYDPVPPAIDDSECDAAASAGASGPALLPALGALLLAGLLRATRRASAS
jgi:hypothetical protein